MNFRITMTLLVLSAAVAAGSAQLTILDATGAQEVELAEEQEFPDLFPDCELGAMPPFGNLFGLPTMVAEELTEDEHIAFNAGTATEVIRLAYRDYARLVWPRVLPFRITV